MTRTSTATQTLHLRLIGMAVRGDRPRCSDPIDHDLWTSDHAEDRAIAQLWCRGCELLDPCAAAGAEHGRFVWGSIDYGLGR
jgi:hypothetical protein